MLRILRAVLILMTIGVAVAIVASHSRMAFFTFLLEVFLLGLIFFFSDFSKPAMGLLLGLVGGAALFLAFLDPEFSSFQARLSVLLQGQEMHSDRFRVWRDSSQMIRDFPWLGTGLGTFQLIFPTYSSVPIILHFSHAHNDWLELLVETGVLGFCLIMTTAILFLVTYVKRLRELPPKFRSLGLGILVSVLAFSVHSVADFNFHITANAYSLAILLGMGIRLIEMKGESP